MSNTPRTDAETWRDEMDHVDTDYTFAQSATVSADFARQLERELTEAREQRDTLAEALRGPVNAAKAADSPSWSEPGESGWYVEEYERTNAKNWLANTKNWLPEAIEALAAVKGGDK